MTTSELLAKLRTCEPDAPVYITDPTLERTFTIREVVPITGSVLRWVLVVVDAAKL